MVLANKKKGNPARTAANVIFVGGALLTLGLTGRNFLNKQNVAEEMRPSLEAVEDVRYLFHNGQFEEGDRTLDAAEAEGLISVTQAGRLRGYRALVADSIEERETQAAERARQQIASDSIQRIVGDVRRRVEYEIEQGNLTRAEEINDSSYVAGLFNEDLRNAIREQVRAELASPHLARAEQYRTEGRFDEAFSLVDSLMISGLITEPSRNAEAERTRNMHRDELTRGVNQHYEAGEIDEAIALLDSLQGYRYVSADNLRRSRDEVNSRHPQVFIDRMQQQSGRQQNETVIEFLLYHSDHELAGMAASMLAANLLSEMIPIMDEFRNPRDLEQLAQLGYQGLTAIDDAGLSFDSS